MERRKEMIGHATLPSNDGYTRCSTWTNPPGIIWIGRGPTLGQHVPFERAIASVTEWNPFDGDRVLRWCWHRRPGMICGVRVRPEFLQGMVEFVLDGAPNRAIELSPIPVDNDGTMVTGLAARSTHGRVAFLAPCTEGDDSLDFDRLDKAQKHGPVFGEPQGLLWFDEKECGPIDGIEALVHATDILEQGVMFTLHGLNVGGGSFSSTQARELGRQLIAAADWWEQQQRATWTRLRGFELRVRRERAGMTLEHVAKELWKTADYVMLIEQGEWPLWRDELPMVEAALAAAENGCKQSRSADNCLRCSDCLDDVHHFSTQYVVFREDEPGHEAAQAGHDFWFRCKHCEAWGLPCEVCEGIVWDGSCLSCDNKVAEA